MDIISGAPLFSSLDKFDSGTGNRRGAVKPLEAANVTTKTDRSLYGERTEVRSTQANSHLGHVFDDGPSDRGGLRYCMNSAALRFIPKEKLVEEGYGKYLPLLRKRRARNEESHARGRLLLGGGKELFSHRPGRAKHDGGLYRRHHCQSRL